MKLFNFTMIAMGIMIIMYLAGVGNSASSTIVNSILLKNTTQINNEVNTGMTIANTPTGFFSSSSSFWSIIGAILAGVIAVGVTKIIIGNYQSQASLDILWAIFAGGIYTIFVMDIIGLLTYIGSITSYSGWEFWVMASILVPFAVMYSFSLISFIKGIDD